MTKKSTVKKYENSLAIFLFEIKRKPETSLRGLAKQLKLNNNFVSALYRLGVVQKDYTDGKPKTVILKNYSPELALQILKFSSNASSRKKTKKAETIQTEFKPTNTKVEPEKLSFWRRLLSIFKF
jgi:hypothetical protein